MVLDNSLDLSFGTDQNSSHASSPMQNRIRQPQEQPRENIMSKPESVTVRNIEAAFAGESMAHAKYRYFAKLAQIGRAHV